MRQLATNLGSIASIQVREESTFSKTPQQVIVDERRKLQEDERLCDPPKWRLMFHHWVSNPCRCEHPSNGHWIATIFYLACCVVISSFVMKAGHRQLLAGAILLALSYVVILRIIWPWLDLDWDNVYRLDVLTETQKERLKMEKRAEVFTLCVFAIPGAWMVLLLIHKMVNAVFSWSAKEARRRRESFLQRKDLSDVQLLEYAYTRELDRLRAQMEGIPALTKAYHAELEAANINSGKEAAFWEEAFRAKSRGEELVSFNGQRARETLKLSVTDIVAQATFHRQHADVMNGLFRRIVEERRSVEQLLDQCKTLSATVCLEARGGIGLNHLPQASAENQESGDLLHVTAEGIESMLKQINEWAMDGVKTGALLLDARRETEKFLKEGTSS